jgi:hypothetical protein
MEQLIAVAGSLLILAAYAGHQRGLIDRTHPAYSWMNSSGRWSSQSLPSGRSNGGLCSLKACGQ